MTSVTEAVVRKTITVSASLEHAFAVFTEGYDSWWPRTHHIGKAPMEKAIIELRAGGRCYSTQVDGTECDWGRVLVWDPPHRLVLAWQITTSGGTNRTSPGRAKSTSSLRRSQAGGHASIWSTGISSVTARGQPRCARRSIHRMGGVVCCSCLRRAPNNRTDKRCGDEGDRAWRISTNGSVTARWLGRIRECASSC